MLFGIFMVSTILSLSAYFQGDTSKDTASMRLPVLPGKTVIPVRTQTMVSPVRTDEKKPEERDPLVSTQAVLVIYAEIVKLHQIEQHTSTPGETISQLQPMLYSFDPAVRLAALESVAELNSPHSLPILIDALSDYHPAIRKASIEGLSMQANDDVARVIEPFLFDNDLSVKIAAIDALAVLGGEQAIASLASLLTDYNPIIRNNAVIALGEIDNALTSQYVLPLQFDPDPRVRNNAESILVEQGIK